ncbi:hypothetical protein [Lentzea albida]|nr:hypothetical protein [Lentzea albida]
MELEEKEHRDFKIICAKSGENMKSIATDLVRDYIRKNKENEENEKRSD